jgi:chorismate mutase
MENQQNKTCQTTCETALLALRQEIDQIDNQIISLLVQRMEVIARVGELKKNHQEKFFIRSNREADMIKDLVKKSGNILPKSTIISIWRKIITTANMDEQTLRIAIHNPNNIPDYTYLVKEYYNDLVPFHNFDSATNVVMEMEKGDAQIGVFALPKDEHDGGREDAKENWWIALANNRLGLKVFAKIPFFEFLDVEKNNNKIELVAVAAKNPEKSSDDNSLLYVEVNKETSRATILAALKENNLDAKILKSVKLQQVEGIVFYLIEVRGFYLEEDKVIKAFSKSKAKAYVKVLGHYATAIKI